MKALLIACTLALAGCVSAPLSVQPNRGSCAALLPPEWEEGVPSAEFEGEGDKVGDWIIFADAQTGRLDQANGRTRDAIGIVKRCEARDASAVKRATKRKFLGIF